MGGTKEIAVLLMVFFSFCSPSPSSSFPLSHGTFPSVRLQENEVKDKEMNEHINFAHGTGGGGRVVNGGQSAGKGENGNNGGTKSPYVPGGTAVIPLYAAGAAGSHHNNHHNAGVRNRSRIGFPTLVAAIFALIIVHICVVYSI